MRSKPVSLLPLVACLALWLAGAQPAFCDRAIVTPTGNTLAPNAANGEILYSLEDDNATALWAGDGLSRFELDGSYFHVADRNSLAVSAETQVLPETFLTPAAAVGIRDIFNATRNTGAVGYGGRAVYIALTKTEPGPAAGGLVSDVRFNAGLGEGSLHGLFGSVSAKLPLGLVGTFEYDSMRANMRIALPLGRDSRLEYVRIGPRGLIGFELHSPVSF